MNSGQPVWWVLRIWPAEEQDEGESCTEHAQKETWARWYIYAGNAKRLNGICNQATEINDFCSDLDRNGMVLHSGEN